MEFDKEYVKQVRFDIIGWNNSHPIDKLWRDFYKVPIFSKEHKEVTFVEQLYWYEERKMYQDIKDLHKEGYDLQDMQVDDTGRVKTKETSNKSDTSMSDEEIQVDFDKLDIDKM